ncbi:MAG TPA: hypothetical protein VKE51_39575 [Vicinamibacterales bacterium]|nr:hypothetical protein [Vicinamibacterales bacterium]
MRRRLKILVVATPVALAAVAAAAWVAVPDDDHRSVRYQLWKRGYQPFRSGFEGAFMADVDRDSIVIGKTREDLAKTFAPLTEGKKNEEDWKEVYAQFRPDDQFVWLWGSNWLVVLRDGRAIYLNYLKG